MERIIEHKPVFLTGFMGAGKSTLGKLLAEKLCLPFFDQDRHIIDRENMSIHDIFEKKGEEAFRRIETEVLQNLSHEPAVISTGGGVVLSKENRQLMKKNGITVFLYCSPSQTEKRLEKDTSRPLLLKNRQETIKVLMEERLPSYLEADYTINTSMKNISSILNELMSLLNKQAADRAN